MNKLFANKINDFVSNIEQNCKKHRKSKSNMAKNHVVETVMYDFLQHYFLPS